MDHAHHFRDKAAASDPTIQGDVASQPPSNSTRLPSPEAMYEVLEASRDAICLVERGNGEITRANRSAERLFGYQGAEWATVVLADLLEEDDIPCAQPEVDFRSARACHREGRHTPVQWSLVGTAFDRVMVALFRPVCVPESRSQDGRDPLTGLPNRDVFERRFAKFLTAGRNDFAVLFLDLDDFKRVNDTFGHAVGDRVLRAIAERLLDGVRPVDAVARYGGDEFVVLLEGIDRQDSAVKATERLLGSICRPVNVETYRIEVSASAGVVLGGVESATLERVIHRADRAMYQAKLAGRGRFVLFDEEDCPPFPAGRQ